MNEAVGMKNDVTVGGGGKRLVCPFIWQDLWKFIGCVILAVMYGKKGHNLWGEIPKYYGMTEATKLQRGVRRNTDLYKVYCDIYHTFYIYAFH